MCTRLDNTGMTLGIREVCRYYCNVTLCNVMDLELSLTHTLSLSLPPFLSLLLNPLLIQCTIVAYIHTCAKLCSLASKSTNIITLQCYPILFQCVFRLCILVVNHHPWCQVCMTHLLLHLSNVHSQLHDGTLLYITYVLWPASVSFWCGMLSVPIWFCVSILLP